MHQGTTWGYRRMPPMRCSDRTASIHRAVQEMLLMRMRYEEWLYAKVWGPQAHRLV